MHAKPTWNLDATSLLTHRARRTEEWRALTVAICLLKWMREASGERYAAGELHEPDVVHVHHSRVYVR